MVLVSEVISITTVIFESDDDCGHPKLYDWLLILPQEVKFIWRAPWNWTTVLYLFTRYIPFVSVAFMLRSELFLRLSAHPPAFRHGLSLSSWTKTHVTCVLQHDLPCYGPLGMNIRSHSTM